MRAIKDRVIVITGASSGIGAATALACAEAGMQVSLAARRVDKLKDIAGQCAAKGVRVHWCECDVNDDWQVRRLFDEVWMTFGRLDACFANAGFGLFSSVLDTTDAQHRAIFETNYFGTVRTIKSAVPWLRRTPGGLQHMLVCTSSASEVGIPMFGAYCATKAAQDSIIGALRGELADEGIAVTGVHPVGTKTEFFDVAAAGSGKSLGPNTPGMFSQTPEHVAKCIVRVLRNPRPEVWPSPLARYALALATACPRFAAYMMRRAMRDAQARSA